MKIEDIYRLIIGILSIGIFWGSLETIYKSSYFKSGAPFDWEIIKSDKISLNGWYYRMFKPIYSSTGMVILMVARILVVLTLLFLKYNLLYTYLVVVLLSITMITYARHTYGMDGADQINIVNLIVIAACLIINSSPESKKFGLIFIAIHLSFAYFVSGIAKLISPTWRNGSAAFGVLTTYTYGTEFSQRLVRNKLFSYFICWFTIIFEVAFPFALILTGPSLIIWLIVGFLFHLSIAITMGLNDFLWAFTAGYPAFYYFSAEILHSTR